MAEDPREKLDDGQHDVHTQTKERGAETAFQAGG
jgi:hypothetical protein